MRQGSMIQQQQQGMRLLARGNRAGYISLIRKHPAGIVNRLQVYDGWVASWKDPHIHSYYDYFYNGETRTHDMYMPNCARAKALEDSLTYNFRPGLADMYQRFFPIDENFADDLGPSQDTSALTLRQFLKGCTRAETRTDLQRLLGWFCGCVLSLGVYVYGGMQKEDVPDVVQLEPHPQYFHYQANMLQKQVEAARKKMQMLDQHCEQVLAEAVRRGEARGRG